MASFVFPLAEIGSIEKTIIIGLATAGGFLVGFVLTNLTGRALCKFVFHRPASEKLIRFARFGGGVLAAILTYMLLSGEGGFGLGGGSGGKGVALKEGDETKQLKSKDQPEVDPKTEKKPPDKKATGDPRAITIIVLPVKKPGVLFYRLEGQDTSLTLEQVVEWIDEQSKMGMPVKTVDVDFVRMNGKADPDTPIDGGSALKKLLDKRQIKTYVPPVE